MRPLSIRSLEAIANRRSVSLLAGCALAVLALPGVGRAQFFRVSAQGGNTFGHPYGPCAAVAYSVTQALPLTDSTACSVDGHLWSGTTAADRGILHGKSYVEYNVFNSLGTEFHNFGQFDQDVVISGPAGLVALTLFLDVEYGENENPGLGLASSGGWVFVAMGPTSSFPFSSPAKQRISVTRTVDANTPTKLNVIAQADTLVGGGGTSAAAEITARFPIGEPVFLLPAGYTANSPELGIVNNYWLGPDLCAFPAQDYCTAKTNSLGCLPAIDSTGQASASSTTPFDVTATQVINQKQGLLFYGVSGPAAIPFQGGTLCVAPPFKRTGALSSGGNPPPDDCSGSFALDFNAVIQAGSDPGLVAGAQVHCQYWYRDPQSASTTGLSNGLAFWICP